MPEKVPLSSTEGLQSKDLYISCIMKRSCAMQESPGKKLDLVNNLFSRKKLNKVKNDSFKHFAEDRKEANRSIIFN